MFGQRNVMVSGKARRKRFPAARTASGRAAAAPPRSVRNLRRLPPPRAGGGAGPGASSRGPGLNLKPELYPKKQGQEDQDGVQRAPHDVGTPPPPLLYGLLAHGEFSLA